MSELDEYAGRLLDIARNLGGIRRDATARASEEQTHELARSVAYLVVAIQRLTETAPMAWRSIDSRFPADDDEPIDGSPSPSDELAELRAEWDVLSVLLAGDAVLEDIAWAELVLRGPRPELDPAGWLPSWWPKLVQEVDAGRADDIADDVRYLDVTLAPARDRLAVHQDPGAWHMPSFSSWGDVRLAREVIDAGRRNAALDRLRKANATLPFPWPDGDYHVLLATLVSVPKVLDRSIRNAIRDAYRLAGFESPPLENVLGALIRLLERHHAAVLALTARSSDIQRR